MKNKSKGNLLHGIAAAPGIAIGKALLFSKEILQVDDSEIENVEDAIKNLDEALSKSQKELNKIFNLAIDKLGEKRAAIFEAQLMILNDPVVRSNIVERIKKERKNPEFIVSTEIAKYQNLMLASGEEYLKERSHDIDDIKNRIIRNLRKKRWESKIQKEMIVVSRTITPADTLLLTRAQTKAYVTEVGGLTSHAAIVARSLNIPAVVGIMDATSKIKTGDILVVDGFHGEVIINPKEEQLNYYKQKLEKLNRYDTELIKLKNLPSVTLDGKEIKITANFDFQNELEVIINNGAEGIGLVRTEQIFDIADSFPDEEEQFETYKNLAEKIYPENVIIRAFDIGGDKVLPVDLKEPNPFLGWRGIRLLLDNPKIFKNQIKAVLRANIHRNIKFMLPMVASVKEITRTKTLINEAKDELKSRGFKFSDCIELGIMIEVPSAAVIVGLLARHVDFMSIGTNDLIQYLLAVDRGNEIISDLYQEFHPSVIKTIAHVINESKNKKVNLSMCGEMAADPIAIPLLVGLGLNSISVAPSSLLNSKKIIRSIRYDEVKLLADKCLEMETENEIKKILTEFYNKLELNLLNN